MMVSDIQPSGRALALSVAPQSIRAVTTGFEQALASVISSSNATQSRRFDVTNMTPNQMQGFAQRLYDEGKIDLTQLFRLQNAGPLHTNNPVGAAARNAHGNTPIDYISYVQDQMTGIASRGGVDDPKAGYRSWSEILSVLQATRQQA